MRVTFKSDNSLGDCPGELSGHGEGDRKLGLVVIQEWWGMNADIIQKAKDIADDGGFVTIVPDLYRGKVALDFEEAGHITKGLDWDGAVKDIRGSVQYLQSLGYKKIGVTGFCMGGALSLAAAALVPEVTAAAPFYGIPFESLCDVSRIKIPLQCHFGELDIIPGLTVKDQDTFKAKLDSGGVQYEFYSYNAGHAFANNASDNFNKECNDLAMTRLYKFMKDKLTE
ncbi:hypothetical protein FSP39_008284 [Pinctada imbricata]|uniref:Dienelactone hydrolase domain-containing protein n=1 Tax=Pinctada imbricata TaxID=66713 RepID=A0AA88XU69_PINIB|nr:hypothetical protein FSP39_008284 [Pinctada imbricata]